MRTRCNRQPNTTDIETTWNIQRSTCNKTNATCTTQHAPLPTHHTTCTRPKAPLLSQKRHSVNNGSTLQPTPPSALRLLCIKKLSVSRPLMTVARPMARQGARRGASGPVRMRAQHNPQSCSDQLAAGIRRLRLPHLAAQSVRGAWPPALLLAIVQATYGPSAEGKFEHLNVGYCRSSLSRWCVVHWAHSLRIPWTHATSLARWCAF